VLHAQRPRGVDGAVLAPEALVLRFFGERSDDRLLIVNLGPDLHLFSAPEPLLAPPQGQVWETVLSTEDPRYGGAGTAPLDAEDNWRIPGHAAVVLHPVEPPDPWQT
jgi:maltooligosyltrehalose trehalohydrolase